MKNAFFKHLIKISDVFYISENIKKLNPNYEIFYNKNTASFEVHDGAKENSFVVSFDKYPNPNLEVKLEQTKVENKAKIFAEIENYNQKLYSLQTKNILNTANDFFTEILSYSNKSTGEISNQQIKKIIEKG